MNDAQLKLMAQIAFDVLNWSRRMGMKKDQQLEQVVQGFKSDVDIADALAESGKH